MSAPFFKYHFRRTLLKKFLSLFSLSAVAFVFQACYGIDTDFRDDCMFEGVVTSLNTQEPISGIEVAVKGLDRLTYTDSAGSYVLFAMVDSSYTLTFTDVDDTLNGLFHPKEVSIDNKSNELYFLNDITLDSQ